MDVIAHLGRTRRAVDGAVLIVDGGGLPDARTIQREDGRNLAGHGEVERGRRRVLRLHVQLRERSVDAEGHHGRHLVGRSVQHGRQNAIDEDTGAAQAGGHESVGIGLILNQLRGTESAAPDHNHFAGCHRTA